MSKMIATTEINLKVPFKDKDQAKSLGARWNANAKVWYIPQGLDTAPFEKWVATNNPTSTQPTTKPVIEATAGENNLFSEDIDAINARLREAYESNEEAF